MGPDRHDRWPVPPARLDFGRGAVYRRPPDPLRTAVRVTAASAAAVVLACLAVAVPCGVFAAVGVWFDDISTADAAQTAVGFGAAAAAAAVPAVLCHRRLARGRPHPGLAAAPWN